MASLNDIRSTFLDYFRKNGHQVVPSSPLVPRNDPTLMFVNSGMVQFKNLFTGVEHRYYTRATTSQKCVRAGGKHNDLDNVGYTARHHTFFEMLGNFSFGDYFKEEAIPLAWNLLTRDFGLPKDRLLVTVYHDDDAAADLWKKVAGLPDERIVRIATSDNFWMMGPTGPCGPCSEIFYDHGDHIPGGPPGSPDEDGDRFIEIWNLVFMQYEQHEDDTRDPLPSPSIDTGMGLERIGAVLQGKHDNYDTDLMRSLIDASARATGSDPDGPGRTHHRVIADHLRSTSFLIADGVMPSNEGRGYVLRRIMRRAMRHAHLLGTHDPVMWRLVPALVTQMGRAFPELARAQLLIEETLRLEETRFKTTLDRGLRLLDDELERLPDGGTLPGEAAFRLYDTYGFPLDLTQDALREKGRAVDVAGFEAAMAEQKRMARAAWSGSGEAADENVWFEIAERAGPTEFLGYDSETAEGQILALVRDGVEDRTVAAGEDVQIVLNQTPFYAESGGQVGDRGVLITDEARLSITDVRRKAGLFVHSTRVEEGQVAVGAAARLEVDAGRRASIRANHSATHLLHEALRRALGDHVAQRGSLVAPDRLRFDFAHSKGMSPAEISGVEAEVNAYVRQNTPVETRIMTPDDAQALGARALFGEKYGDEVRVVSMGELPGSGLGAGGDTYSLELCGGTHVRRTGDIGAFKLISEGASASGIPPRRGAHRCRSPRACRPGGGRARRSFGPAARPPGRVARPDPRSDGRTEDPDAGCRGSAPQARPRRRGRGRARRAGNGRRHGVRRPDAVRRVGQGPPRPHRRAQDETGIGRGPARGRYRRPSCGRGRRHRRSDRAGLGGGSRPGGRRGAWRKGRRRSTGHGAGRRDRPLESGRRHRRGPRAA